MQIQFKQWLFQPHLITSVIAILVFSLFVKLGLWQLQRAEYKKEKYNTFLTRQAQPPVELESLMGLNNAEDNYWRTVRTTGYFNTDLQILLDNRVVNSKAGYFVYTPFNINNSEKYVLVNRGWIKADVNRKNISNIDITDELTAISGVIKAEPLTGIILKEFPPEKIKDNIYRVQKIKIEELNKQLKLDLLPFIFRLEPESKHGYVREWAKPGSDEAKHLGYAYQWFAFAITLLIIYLLLNIKKVKDHEQ